MKKVGLMGGSFDPVHIGHISVVSEAFRQFDLDEFYFIPTGINPWKDKTVASNEQRIKMLELAIENIDTNKKIKIYKYEINHANQKNYTYKTLEHLTHKHKKTQYYYFMGCDQMNNFHLWKKASQISIMVQLVYFDRGGYKYKRDNIKKYHFLKLTHQKITASSTAIRKGNLSLLNDNVLDYIGETGLYLNTMIRPRMKEKRYKHSLSVAKYAREFAMGNGLDANKAYIAGVLHDVAKEMPHNKALKLMKQYYPEYVDKPEAIWHQWLSAYVARTEFHVYDEEILKAIEDHTTASTEISKLGMCLYCADKLDPLRGYDSSKDIEICRYDIELGFQRQLDSFYFFSKSKGRKIDECFFEVYKKFGKGEL